ncbi:MAG: hypothetical protein IKL96_10280 [Kiritimatiellae bacterium]|nr:hypothetical protein [Kiritimatiellia bacterium]
MLFCACRVADVLNAFVGLWLVPKYVGQSELGAVLPLSNFAMFIAIPASAFATVFMKEVNTLSTNGELGKMKTLVRGVFMVMSALLIISAIAAKLVLPFFLERLRIVEGMLGFLIIASAFAGCAAPVYSNVLQALKRFKEVSLINILAAPMRFAVMLCLMPFRALSGYFAGQTAAPMTNILLSVLFLRKYFRVRAEPYWNSNAVKKLSRLFAAVLAYQMFPAISGLVEAIIIRQRLPEVESGAYYMATRFYDLAGFINGTLLAVMFPYTAELAEKGKSTKPLVVKASAVTLAFGILLAALFAVVGEKVLCLLPHGDEYSKFAWVIPCMIMMATMIALISYHTSTEVSAGRFTFLKWWIPFHLFCPVFLLVVTGYGYFVDILPASLTAYLSKHNFTSLKAMVIWLLLISAVKLAISCTEFYSKEDGQR